MTRRPKARKPACGEISSARPGSLNWPAPGLFQEVQQPAGFVEMALEHAEAGHAEAGLGQVGPKLQGLFVPS